MLRHLFTLLSAGTLWCVAGCVYIPSPGLFSANQWNGVVGDAASLAPLRVGESDRAQVRDKLGEPVNQDGNGQPPDHFWEYEKYTPTGYLLVLFPFIHGWHPFEETDRRDCLAIWFGSDGRMRRYIVWDGYAPPKEVAKERRSAFEKWESGPADREPTTRPGPATNQISN